MLERLIVLVALLAVGCGGGPARRIDGPVPAGDGPPVVILISLDGFRHDYPARVETPAFDRLAREGARAGRLLPVFPSQTFPNHAALATGVHADRHGILNNRFLDPERGLFDYDDHVAWYDHEPIWIHTARRGVRTHVFHWIGIAGERDGVAPAVALRYDKSVTDDEKVDRILAWLAAPPDRRPRLVMSYFRGCDRVGHVYGPAAPQVADCVRETDARLGRLLAALDPARATLVVVSDHGMTATRGEIDPEEAFEEAGVAARVVAVGPVAHVYLEPGADPEAARAAAAKLPHVTIHRRDALPPDWRYRHPTRTGDLVLLADFGWRFDPDLDALEGPPSLAGHHGHPPEHPDMGAIFFAWGAGVRPGASVDRARAVDVVPTVCRLLGLEPPPDLDGRALGELLVPVALSPGARWPNHE